MTDQEKISYIIKNEIIITQSIFKGHKAAEGDEFHEIRKKIYQYRLELGLVKPRKI